MRTGPLIATLAVVAWPTPQDRPDEPSRRLELSPTAIRLDGEWLVEPAPGLERWAAEIVRVRILDHDQERIELRIDPATRWGVVREVLPWLRRDEVWIDGRLVAPPVPSGRIEWATLRVDADRAERPEG